MENNRLALLGGDKVIKKNFLKPSNFDHEEKNVVNKVLDKWCFVRVFSWK